MALAAGMSPPSSAVRMRVEDTGFSDVAADAWYAGAVEYVRDNGLMSGKGDGVAPVANTTVEEAIVLIRALYNKF